MVPCSPPTDSLTSKKLLNLPFFSEMAWRQVVVAGGRTVPAACWQILMHVRVAPSWAVPASPQATSPQPLCTANWQRPAEGSISPSRPSTPRGKVVSEWALAGPSQPSWCVHQPGRAGTLIPRGQGLASPA